MIKKSWQEILNEHTRYFTNGRYDILSKNLVRTKIADIKTDDHKSNNEYYRSYGTYRHNIAIDTSLIKINETNIPENEIIEGYYNVSYIDTSYSFSGIVLALSYAVNSNEISLEDLFAEYGYDYLKAKDLSALNNGLSTYYFENKIDSETEYDDATTEIGWTYQILPYGSIYKDEEDIDESTGLPKEKLVEYDGKYCPTVQEIIDGSLYIVIQSGSKAARRIYFNNNYLPSMFINDDKLSNNLETYILGNQQTLKLCDIALYSRIGVEVKWDKLIGIKNLYKFLWKLERLLTPYINEDDHAFNHIKFKTYLYVTYKVTTLNKTKYLIRSMFDNLKPASGIIKQDDINNLLVEENREKDEITEVSEDGYYNFLQSMTELTNTTNKVYVGKISDTNLPKLNIAFYFGISVLLEGFSLTYADLSEHYTLSWYEYNENVIPYNIQFNLLEYNIGSDSGLIYINNTDLSTIQNSKCILYENKLSGNTLSLNIKLTDLTEDNNLIFNLSAIDDTNNNIILKNQFENTESSEQYIQYNNINIIKIIIENNNIYLTVLNNNITENFNEGNIKFKFINEENNISFNGKLNIIYENG